ncbi:hypothetical protein D3C80_974610 [compost metagenome]
MVTDGGHGFAGKRLDAGGIDTGTLEHGFVGPTGMVVPANEQDGRVGPFALVEALFQFGNLAPVGGGKATDAEHVAMPRLAVIAPATQALLQLVEGQHPGFQVRGLELYPTEYGMAVGIDESRHQHLALQVDDLGTGILEREYLGIAADPDNLAIGHRDRLLQCLALLGGEHLAVVQQQVDGRHAFH